FGFPLRRMHKSAPLRWYRRTPVRRDRSWTARPFDECEEIGVQTILVGRTQAMRGSVVHLERCFLDQFGRKRCRGRDPNELVVVAIQDQRRNVELLEIFG